MRQRTIGRRMMVRTTAIRRHPPSGPRRNPGPQPPATSVTGESMPAAAGAAIGNASAAKGMESNMPAAAARQSALRMDDDLSSSTPIRTHARGALLIAAGAGPMENDPLQERFNAGARAKREPRRDAPEPRTVIES